MTYYLHNLLEIFAEHPLASIRGASEFNDHENEVMKNIIAGVIHLVDKMPDEALVVRDQTVSLMPSLLDYTLASNGYDGARLLFLSNWIQGELVEPTSDPEGVHDPDCGVWEIPWLWRICTTKPGCVVRHAAASATQLCLGVCIDPNDTGVCRCKQACWDTETVIILIGIGAFILGGPAIGTAARTLLQRLAVRAAAAGA